MFSFLRASIIFNRCNTHSLDIPTVPDEDRNLEILIHELTDKTDTGKNNASMLQAHLLSRSQSSDFGFLSVIN